MYDEDYYDADYEQSSYNAAWEKWRETIEREEEAKRRAGDTPPISRPEIIIIKDDLPF